MNWIVIADFLNLRSLDTLCIIIFGAVCYKAFPKRFRGSFLFQPVYRGFDPVPYGRSIGVSHV